MRVSRRSGGWPPSILGPFRGENEAAAGLKPFWNFHQNFELVLLTHTRFVEIFICLTIMVQDLISANSDELAPLEFLGSKKRRCAPKLNTQERLFGQVAPPAPPKKISDTFRSKIFDNSVPGSPPRTPKKTLSVLERNPITGEERPPKKINM